MIVGAGGFESSSRSLASSILRISGASSARCASAQERSSARDFSSCSGVRSTWVAARHRASAVRDGRRRANLGSVLHPDRLLPPEPGVLAIARSLYEHSRGCRSSARTATGPRAAGRRQRRSATRRSSCEPGPLPAADALQPGCPAGGPRVSRSTAVETPAVDGREVWRTFAEHAHLFRADALAALAGAHPDRGARGGRAPRARVGGPHVRRDVGPPPRSGVPPTPRSTTGSASSCSPPPTAPSTRSTRRSDPDGGWPGRVVPVPPRRHRRPGTARLPRQPRPARRSDRRGHHDLVGYLAALRPGAPVRRRRRHRTDHGHPTAQRPT